MGVQGTSGDAEAKPAPLEQSNQEALTGAFTRAPVDTSIPFHIRAIQKERETKRYPLICENPNISWAL